MGDGARRLDAVRAAQGELENHYIDELVAGRVDRRTFLRRGAVIGLSASTMGAVLAACGGANATGGAASSSAQSAAAPTAKGGTLRLATQAPATALNPLLIDDAGGACVIAQTGEFLVFDDNMKLRLEPMLATSWRSSEAGRVWTFTLRRGVKFHGGGEMTARDVAYTMRQMADPKNASNALSTFGGVLTPAGVHVTGRYEVRFELEAANGNFPYLVSSDNFNAIIVPEGTDWSKWHETFVGTGPFVLKSFQQNQSVSFTANPDYWGGAPSLAETQFTFYESQQPQIVALQGGDVDVVVQFVPQGAEALLHSTEYSLIKLESSMHRELSMRCDRGPFSDARVRRAIALCIDRPAIVTALLAGDGQLGNDSPFAPMFRSTDRGVPQRVQDVATAKQLLAAAGHPRGFAATLYTEQYDEVPALAQIFGESAKAIGVDITLKVETQATYYGKATFGNSDWLDGEMSLVDYGHRGVPNVFLESALTTKGTWNAAHFHDARFDALVRRYVGAVDLASQRTLAGKLQTLLLDETPIVVPYFIDGLTAMTSKVSGLNPTAMSQIFLRGAGLAA